MTKISKVENGLPPELINDVFEFIEKPYSRNPTNNFAFQVEEGPYSRETPSYLGPKLWNLVPNECKTV